MNIRLLVAFGACVFAVTGIGSVHAVPVTGQGTWESTLQGRDLDGNAATFEAYYDTTLRITWLADTYAAGTNMTWAAANAWAAGLNVNGITGWRLPTLSPINGSTFDSSFSYNATTDDGYADSVGWVDGSGNPVSEMGNMYYVTLGNLGYCEPISNSSAACTVQTGGGLTNTGPFSNFGPFSSTQSGFYWTDTKLDPGNAWFFDMIDGDQDFTDLVHNHAFSAWAVRSGDVGKVSIPAAVWLFGSGLLGLIGTCRSAALRRDCWKRSCRAEGRRSCI